MVLNSTMEGTELNGKGYTIGRDLLIGWLIVMLCLLQIVFGAIGLWIIKKITIFHNAFGFLCATRTAAEILGSFLHISYAGPVTVL
uniref:7TM_GPCR_Srx domain-containing protein n=1 Tax=Steinernema glaseri TaxID=37863 RepID=A0A1I7Z4B3_9BILA